LEAINSAAPQLLTSAAPTSSGALTQVTASNSTKVTDSNSLVDLSFHARNAQGSRFGLGATGSGGASGKVLDQHLTSSANSSSMTLPSISSSGHGGNNQSDTTNLGSNIGGNFSGSSGGSASLPNGASRSGGGVAAVTTFLATPVNLAAVQPLVAAA
jgi:hypothetical protein